MDRVQLVESSRKNIVLADHLLHTSYPLLRDPKLFGVALQAVFVAASRSAKALIGGLDVSYGRRIDAFRHAVAKHELRSDYVNLLSDLETQVKRIKTSSTIFTRKEKLILLEQEQPHELTLEKLKDFSFRTKSLIVDVMHKTNERRY